METGHLLKWEANSIGDQKNGNNLDGPVVLTVEDFGILILLYWVIISMALLSFIGERLTSKNIRKNNRGVWKWIDKLIFSTGRLVCKNKYQVEDPVWTLFHGKNKV